MKSLSGIEKMKLGSLVGFGKVNQILDVLKTENLI